MRVATRVSAWIFCVGFVVSLPAFGSMSVAAAASGSGAASTSHSGGSPRVTPFLPLTTNERATTRKRPAKRGNGAPVTLRAASNASGSVVGGQTAGQSATSSSTASNAPLITSTAPDDLAGFAGTAQASTIHSFGGDQEVTPPNEDIAAGPTDLVEVVNSTVEIWNRAGGYLGSDDLNTFMSVTPGYHSSDPRVIYDASSGRFWITITEVPDAFSSPSDCPVAQPILIAVSGSSNPLPFGGWLVYSLPMETFGGTSGQPLTEFGDQPGLGAATNTIAVTFDDFTCDLQFNGAEVDILQKSDLITDEITGNSDDFWFDFPFAPQPVQSFGAMPVQYVVVNESDCGPSACVSPPPEAEVDAFTGTPEGGGGVTLTPNFAAMTATAVNDTTGLLPSAIQPSPGPALQTNDDRFLNAVWENGEIWTADGTSCVPPGDTPERACLDYVEIAADNAGNVSPTLTNQINNVGINGAYLFYPAVSVDAAGNMITVFDESSSALSPSIVTAAIPAGGSTLSSFVTLHTSLTYYDGDFLFGGACDSNGCRWGDYSGAAQDPANPNDVWVVSGAEDGSVEGACSNEWACWNTRINQLTVSGPTITSLTPSSGPVAGGQTVTVRGFDFASDTSASFGGSPISITNLTPESFQLVTPSHATTGGTAQIQATDSLGSSVEDAASLYTYVALANYVPLSPSRILDTRKSLGGSPLGPGATLALQVTGGVVPSTATAVVMNVTEVLGTANSLLVVYPFGTTRPNASNLNFNAGTVIPNLVTVTLGAGGKVDIFNAVGTVNVVADVEGYFTPQPSSDFEGLFHPISPLRVCDTRPQSPTPPCKAHGALGPEASMVVNVTGGTAGIPTDGTAGAAVLNVTGVVGSAGTYLTVFPTNSSGGCAYSGSHAPPSSTLNLSPGAVEANRVMVQLGPGTTGGPTTSVCVYNSAGTINVVLDANGWFGSPSATATPSGYQYQALAPIRICDTRVGSASCPKATIGPATSRQIVVAGQGGVPAVGAPTVVVAIVANLTAVTPTTTTFLTLYPASIPTHPTASDLNVNAGKVLPNLAVVQLDTIGDSHDGAVDLYNSVGAVNAIIDIEGWFQ